MEDREYKEKGFALLGVLALIAATVAAGIVGYQYVEHTQKVNQPLSAPSPTISPASRTTITVINATTHAPIPHATLVFTTHIACIQVVGYVCPQPTPVTVTTDEKGEFVVTGDLPGDSVEAKATGYESSEKVEVSLFDAKLQAVTQKNTITLSLTPLK